MNIINKINIDRPVADVWKVLGDNFDRASEWMSMIPKSYASGVAINGAPMAGRTCELSPKQNGPIMNEMIEEYDAERHVLKIRVEPKNATPGFPLGVYWVTISLNSAASERTEVTWATQAKLKFMGYFLYPLVKFGLAKGFGNILEELKHYVEEDAPHPRKVKKLEAQTA